MATDALIFDDDGYFGGLMVEILTAQGFTVKYFPDAEHAMERIREESPGLVLTDIMMPGLDGITLCQRVKSDPAMAHATKVVVVSGKTYPEDKARAVWAKADLYLEKPFNVADFGDQIRGLMKGREPKRKDGALGWTARVWGGEQEPGCVSFRHEDALIVFDAGDALDSVAEASYASDIKEVWLLLSHYHESHIAGLAHVTRWVKAGVAVHMLGPADAEFGLQRLAKRALSEEAASWVRTQELRESENPFEGISGLSVSVMATLHPGPCLAYRIQAGGQKGRSIVFFGDSELDPNWEEEVTDYASKVWAFSSGADLLIHDARFSDEDIASMRGRGHSSPTAVARLAAKAGVKRLLLYHTDPKYSEQERRALAGRASAAAGKIRVDLARDGLEIDI